MPTLLLRLSGPMQAWGTDSKIDTRRTDGHPSKSGVIGMVAAAMGRSRDDPIDDLRGLRFGVRTDQEGTLVRDYHTAHHPEDKKLAYITNRYYLEDALFVAGLEGDTDLLMEIDEAVRRPYFPLFLGRRSCPPTGRISLGLRETTLEEALRIEPWQAAAWYRRRMPKDLELEMTVDADGTGGYLVRDLPVTFSQEHRSFEFRRASTIGTGVVIGNPDGRRRERSTDHDAFKDLEAMRCTFRG